MFTAILWDYDGTLANTPVKNLAVTRAVLARLDPALLDPLPEALTSLAAYQAANYRWRNWRELYRHALHVPVDRLDAVSYTHLRAHETGRAGSWRPRTALVTAMFFTGVLARVPS